LENKEVNRDEQAFLAKEVFPLIQFRKLSVKL